MNNPLSDLKILDFTYLLPGPYATMILSDLGADIIKVENFINPDLTRFLPPFIDDISVVYSQLNKRKKSLALDLKQEKSSEIIHRLIADYDIIIEQFRPGVMKRICCDYESLRRIKPSLIYCSLTGYGQTGQYSDRAGHDINYLAVSGLSSLLSHSINKPVLSSIQLADIAGGAHNAAMAIMAAYIQRIRTGAGEYIDLSITDGAFALSSFIAPAIINDLNASPYAEGFLDGGSLYDYYQTQDQHYLSVGPLEHKFFTQFCKVVGCADLIEQGIGAIHAKKRIAAIIASKPVNYWIDLFKESDACVEKVKSINEAVVEAPINERDMIQKATTRNGFSIQYVANPIKFASRETENVEAALPLGYSTESILHKVGYSDNDIKHFKSTGCIPS